MREAARVTSLEALARFRSAWAEFGDATRLALSNAESDIQKTMWWLQNDQKRHWQVQIKRREKKLADAKAELHSAETASRDSRPSLVLERKRFEKCKRAVEEARGKLERTQYWARILEREFLLYKGQTNGLSGRLERDIPKGLARLAALMDSLEKYVKMAPPTSDGAAPPLPDTAEAPDEENGAASEVVPGEETP